MLTGDKLETATCIAQSSRLVARNQMIHTFKQVIVHLVYFSNSVTWAILSWSSSLSSSSSSKKFMPNGSQGGNKIFLFFVVICKLYCFLIFGTKNRISSLVVFFRRPCFLCPLGCPGFQRTATLAMLSASLWNAWWTIQFSSVRYAIATGARQLLVWHGFLPSFDQYSKPQAARPGLFVLGTEHLETKPFSFRFPFQFVASRRPSFSVKLQLGCHPFNSFIKHVQSAYRSKLKSILTYFLSNTSQNHVFCTVSCSR